MRVQESHEATLCDASHQIEQHLTCAVYPARPARNPSIRRAKRIGVTRMLVCLFLFALSAAAQVEGPLRPQAALPPAENQSAPDVPAINAPAISELSAVPVPAETIKLPLDWPVREPALPELPARVEIPANRPIAVILDTPLSTRISKKGQIVTFRISYSILVGDGLEVPPDTEILGHVVEIKRPGHFGKQGVLRVTADRLKLDEKLEAGESANLEAHLDSRDMKGQGRLASDKRRSTDLYSVAIDAVAGTLLGAMIGGAKGAGIGAGAGVAAAVLIMMSHRGGDVYLEPGMPFSVILDQPAYLSGPAIYAAQQNYLKNRRAPAPEADSQPGAQNRGTPELKRRSQPISPQPTN